MVDVEELSWSKFCEKFKVLLENYSTSRILLVTVTHVMYSITMETIHQVFFPHGLVDKIVLLQQSTNFQALIKFQNRLDAISARNCLHGRYIYDGCCRMNIQFYKDNVISDYVEPTLESQATIPNEDMVLDRLPVPNKDMVFDRLPMTTDIESEYIDNLIKGSSAVQQFEEVLMPTIEAIQGERIISKCDEVMISKMNLADLNDKIQVHIFDKLSMNTNEVLDDVNNTNRYLLKGDLDKILDFKGCDSMTKRLLKQSSIQDMRLNSSIEDEMIGHKIGQCNQLVSTNECTKKQGKIEVKSREVNQLSDHIKLSLPHDPGGSGFSIFAARMGLPNTGFISYGKMVDQGQQITQALSLLVIGDGDNGYENTMNVKRTIKGYIRAGFVVIILEDQVSREEVIMKIKTTIDSRKENGLDIVIVAHTDSRQALFLGESFWISKAFVDTETDLFFIDALAFKEEMKAFCEVSLLIPKMANMFEGRGKTQMLTSLELEEIGYKLVAYLFSLIEVSNQATHDSLATQKVGHILLPRSMQSFEEIKEILGSNRYYEEEQRYKTSNYQLYGDRVNFNTLYRQGNKVVRAYRIELVSVMKMLNTFSPFDPGLSRICDGWRMQAVILIFIFLRGSGSKMEKRSVELGYFLAFAAFCTIWKWSFLILEVLILPTST